MANSKEKILRAIGTLIQEQGIAHVNTRQIASAASVSEATLFKLFGTKPALMLEAIHFNSPARGIELPGGDADTPLSKRIGEIIGASLKYFDEALPLTAGLMADKALMEMHQKSMKSAGAPTSDPAATIQSFFAAEQKAGRIVPGADPEFMALLVRQACLGYAYQRAMLADKPGGYGRNAFKERLAQEFVHNYGTEKAKSTELAPKDAEQAKKKKSKK